MTQQPSDLRRAQHAVLAGHPIPIDVESRLLAQGVDVGALETRLSDSVQQQPKQETVH